MRAVVATFLLLLVGSAAFGAPKCSFESLISKAQAEAEAGQILPARFVRPLGFPEADLAVRQLGYHQESTDVFRAFVFLPGTNDLLLFIRKANETVIFWRVSPSGEIRTTVASGSNWIEVRSNTAHAADYAAVRDFFCERIEAEKEKAPPAR